MRDTYGPVLAIPAVPRLLGGVLLAGADLGLVPIALVMVVSTHLDSYARSGLILAAMGIGAATWPFVQGKLFDKYGVRLCAIPLALLTSAGLVMLLFTCTARSAVPAVAAAALVGACRPALAAPLRDAWPRLIGSDEGRLRAAIALDAAVFELLYLFGTAVCVVVLALAPPAAAIVVAAVSVIVGALLFVSAGPLPDSAEALEPTESTDAAAPPHQLWLVAGWAPFGMVFGAFEVIAPAIAKDGWAATAGILAALIAVGSTLGALGYGLRRKAGRPFRITPASLMWAAICLAIAALQGGLLGIALITVPLGAVFAPFAIETTRALVANGFAGATTSLLWTLTLMVLGNGVGTAVTGAIMDRADWRAAAAAMAVVAFASATALSLTRPSPLQPDISQRPIRATG